MTSSPFTLRVMSALTKLLLHYHDGRGLNHNALATLSIPAVSDFKLLVTTTPKHLLEASELPPRWDSVWDYGHHTLANGCGRRNDTF